MAVHVKSHHSDLVAPTPTTLLCHASRPAGGPISCYQRVVDTPKSFQFGVGGGLGVGPGAFACLCCFLYRLR